MGYHSAQDNRIPDKLVCFDCRVRADRNWDLIVVHDLYPRMMARFKDLAIQRWARTSRGASCSRADIFRRGIKLFETRAPDGLSAFTKLIGQSSNSSYRDHLTKLPRVGCDSTVAGQVFKRLEAEGEAGSYSRERTDIFGWVGFIAQETRELDGSGLMETTTVVTRRRGRGGKANPKHRTGLRRKNLQKPVYVFVQNIKHEDIYKDYFNPYPEVEKRLLGLSDLVWFHVPVSVHSSLASHPETGAQEPQEEE